MKVSILLPVYNEERHLKDAISSVLSQSYENWELIIVDNCSTDNTLNISNKFSSENKKIKTYSIPEKGMVIAYNYAYSQSTGDLICFLSGDDILPLDSLEKRVNPFLQYPNQDIFTTILLKTFSENKKFDGIVYPKNINNPNYSAGSLMFKKNIATKIFPMPLELPNEDVWTSLHLKTYCKNIHIPEVLHLYRIHSNNTYGYDMRFEEKRNKFLKRMNAYDIFLKKYESLETPIKDYLMDYNKAVNLLKNSKSILPILLGRNKLSATERLKFAMYSNKILFWFRYKLFNLFSGLSN
jgi:glycosyltransferase involved in cell wall biosynthesis